MKTRFYVGVFKLPNRSKQSAKYSTQKMKEFSHLPANRKTEWWEHFQVSSNISNYLKHKGKAGEEAGEACIGQRL